MPWNDPLLKKSTIQPYQDQLEQPIEGQSPLMAGIKGFGSGALEGLRNLTKPTELAGMAMMAIPGGGLVKGAKAASEIPEALSGLSNLAHITPDLVEAAPAIKQVMPGAADVADLTGLLRHNLAKIPQGGAKGAMQGLQSALPAEFVAPGAESGYNAVRQLPQIPKPRIWGEINPGRESEVMRKLQLLGQQ